MKKTVDGLILREVPLGDSDKLLTVLTASEGRFSLTAKGARSMKSRVIPLCRLYTYANLEYYEKNGRRWLSGGSVNRAFFTSDVGVEEYALAAYILQVATELSDEGEEAEALLRMTLNTLHAIEKKIAPIEQIKAVYEWFCAMSSGYCPDLGGCVVCKKDSFAAGWLDVMNGCLICEECQRKRSGSMPVSETDRFETRNILVPIDISALTAMRYVQKAPANRIFSFSLTSKDSLDAFSRSAETYLLNHLERDFDTLSFYRSVKE